MKLPRKIYTTADLPIVKPVNKNQDMKAIVTSWLHENIGDTAGLEILQNLLANEGIQLTPIPDIDIHLYDELPDLCIMGAGTHLQLSFDVRTWLLHKMLAKGIPCMLWGTGIYVDPVKGPAKMSPHTLHVLEGCSYVGVRGWKSQQILMEQGFARADAVGDASLCISTGKSMNRENKIAINIGDTTNTLYGMDERYVVSETIKLIEKINNSYEVHLVPMWSHDTLYLTEIHKALPQTVLRPWVPDVHAVINFFKSCYCVIGQKLHACVLAAAAETPFISMAYREKCIDFADYMDMGDFVVKTDEKKLADKLHVRLGFIANDHDDVIKKIQMYKRKCVDKHKQIAKIAKQIIRPPENS